MTATLPGQISLFDWMPQLLNPTAYPDINTIPEAEAVRIVGEQIGVAFAYVDKFCRWQGKAGKMLLYMQYDNYNLPGHARFLGVGYDCRTSGGGSPCDNIQEAVDYFKCKLGAKK